MKNSESFVFISFGLFCLLSGFFLKNDFWQDEVYTLKYFVFLSWKSVMFDYHSTNNHIAFNFILKLYSFLLDLNSGTKAFDYPLLIRIIPYTLSILTLLLFYKNVKKYYSTTIALIALSIFSSTIVFLNFSNQVRGYSLSVLLTTIQYFSFLCVLNDRKRNDIIWLSIITIISLLCLPTNIYITFTYLIICLFIFLFPLTCKKFIDIKMQRSDASRIVLALFIPVGITFIYYYLLLQMQVSNPLLNNYQFFRLVNLRQLFAIFFHFTDNRFHFYALIVIGILLYFKRKPIRLELRIILPIVLFTLPFFLFFVHGTTIVQRIFISLIPFYVIFMAFFVNEINNRLRSKIYLNCFYAVNIISLLFSYTELISSSKRDNMDSIHKHDLRNHYYLVNFNAKEATLKAKDLIQKGKLRLFVLDDFGQTGINYYLQFYNVPFETIQSNQKFDNRDIIITNNKKSLEIKLASMKLKYTKIFEDTHQYNIFVLN